MNRTRGFTLIEMGVVLFIISLLASAIAQYLIGQVASAKLGITQTRQAAIKSALINFIAKNNRLPCPAIANVPSGTPGDGVEAATPGACTATILAPPVATGVIPWVTLGLSSDTAIDGYNNRFTYQVTLAATNLNVQTVMGMSGAITIHNIGLGVLGSASATPPGDQVNDCRANLTVAYVPSANPCAAVAVVVSHGADGYGAFNDRGVRLTFPGSVTGLDELANADDDSRFVMKGFSSSDANPFDDIVLALTPNDLIGGLANTGGMQSTLAVVNANFGLIKSAIITYAVQNRSGNFVCVTGSCTPTTNCPGPSPCETTSFTYTILPPDTPDVADPVGNAIPIALNLPASITTDPWGNPIKYARIAVNATITSSNPPASVIAFVLRSAGPDGILGNTDDLSTTVYVGEVRTLFSKY